MVIAVTTVTVMQMAVHNVVNVIAMRNCFVSASFTVHVTSFVVGAGVTTRATAAVIQRALVYVVAMLAVKMSVMNIVNVIAMLNGSMSAASAMFMIMFAVCFAISHFLLQSTLVIKTIFSGSAGGSPAYILHENCRCESYATTIETTCLRSYSSNAARAAVTHNNKIQIKNSKRDDNRFHSPENRFHSQGKPASQLVF